MDSKVTSLEINQNKLEQYSRRNNIEVSGILDLVEGNWWEWKIISVFTSIGINVKSNDIEACCMEKAEIVLKKQLSVLIIESLSNKHFIREKN